MTNVPAFSPGCFGSALAYDMQIPACAACSFNAECKPVHLANLAALQDHFGVTKTPARTRVSKPVGASQPAAIVLSPATRKMIEHLDQGNFRIIEKMQNGENPFDGSFQFMRITCHLLMRMMKPLNRPYLATCLISKLGCTPSQAESYARVAFQSLAHIGAIDVVDGLATLRRH